MRGVIPLSFKDMIVSKYGQDRWLAIVAEAGYKRDPLFLPISDFDDEVVTTLLDASAKILNQSLAQVSNDFGEHWITIASQKMYGVYYEESTTAKELLTKMDNIHVKLTHHIPNSNPPRFGCEWENENTLIMAYRSNRGMIDYLIGLIQGVGKLYNEPLQVTKLSDDQVKVIFL